MHAIPTVPTQIHPYHPFPAPTCTCHVTHVLTSTCVLAAYEKALSLADHAEQKSQVYAAMGMLAYRVNDLEGSKSALSSW